MKIIRFFFIIATLSLLACNSVEDNLNLAKGELFDDFNYSSSTDPALTSFGWSVRSWGGGPGPTGCTWSTNNVSFYNDGGNQMMRLSSSTNGQGSGTSQSSISYNGDFLEGTYAARVYFTNAPFHGGPDGDQIVETFFTISPLEYNLDPNYCEVDFEYLANGGWGKSNETLWMTSWETYQSDPWIQDSISNHSQQNYEGWNTYVFIIADNKIKYYVNGTLLATQSGKYYPESLMGIYFNLWFIGEGLVDDSGTRTYIQDVDWVYHAQNQVVSPDEIDQRVNYFRSNSTHSLNTIE